MNTAQFRLIDHGWRREFEDAGKLKACDLLIISPFMKTRAVKRLTHGKENIRVLTRFCLHDFFEGVSDLGALRHLLDVGAEVRGIKYLHAKVYVFGDQRSIVTSANLTDAALTRNHELGFVSEDAAVLSKCRDYFDRLWNLTGKQDSSLNFDKLKKWEAELAVAKAKQGGAKSSTTYDLDDYGADLEFMPDEPVATVEPTISKPAFVKFFGRADNRSSRSHSIFEEVKGSESHWSLSYPKGKRPRQPKTGDVMFIARMVHSKNDMLIYGRAVAYKHQPGRDDASAEDIQRRDWKKQWCHYIRVRDPQFIAGTLENAISLNKLMSELKAEAFASTAKNKRRGTGNFDPRKAIMRKAQVLLSSKATNWLNAEFNHALNKHGRIATSELEELHWPSLPSE